MGIGSVYPCGNHRFELPPADVGSFLAGAVVPLCGRPMRHGPHTVARPSVRMWFSVCRRAFRACAKNRNRRAPSRRVAGSGRGALPGLLIPRVSRCRPGHGTATEHTTGAIEHRPAALAMGTAEPGALSCLLHGSMLLQRWLWCCICSTWPLHGSSCAPGAAIGVGMTGSKRKQLRRNASGPKCCHRRKLSDPHRFRRRPMSRDDQASEPWHGALPGWRTVCPRSRAVARSIAGRFYRVSAPWLRLVVQVAPIRSYAAER